MMFEEFQRPLVDVATQPPDTNAWINDTLFRESAADQQRALEGANQVGDVAQQAHIAENANNQQQFVQGVAEGMKQAERFAPPLTSEHKTNNETFAGSLSTVGENPSEDANEPIPTSEQIAQQKQAIAQAIPLTQEMYYKNLLGDYDMSSTDYYKQQYDAIRKAGYSWRIAKEVAGERAQLYQQQRLNQLGRQFVNEGTNGLAVNGVGAQLLNEMQAENPQSVGVLSKMFASPLQQWDYLGKTDMQNARFQHQDALAQYQAQVRQALQNQRLAQQFELAAYKFQLADAAKQREYLAKAQTLLLDNPGMSQEEAITRAMAGAGGRGSSSGNTGNSTKGKRVGGRLGMTLKDTESQIDRLEKKHANDENTDWQNVGEDAATWQNLQSDYNDLIQPNSDDYDFSNYNDEIKWANLTLERLMAQGYEGEELKNALLMSIYRGPYQDADAVATDILGKNSDVFVSLGSKK